MAANLNKILVIGRLGSDPEMRYTSDGTPVTTFSVAVNRRSPGPDGERKEETEWFRVVAWRRLAETCNQYLTKGREAYIEGRLQSQTWQGQDGQARFTNEIVASSVIFLGQDSGSMGPAMDSAPVNSSAIEDPDDLPF